MQQLLGDRSGIEPSFLKELFLQRLPQGVRMVLASTPEGTATALSTLAETADKVMEVATLSAVAALHAHPSGDPPAPPEASPPLPPSPPATAADIEHLHSENA